MNNVKRFLARFSFTAKLSPVLVAMIILGCGGDIDELICVTCSDYRMTYCLYNSGGGNYSCEYMNVGKCNGTNYGTDNTCGNFGLAYTPAGSSGSVGQNGQYCFYKNGNGNYICGSVSAGGGCDGKNFGNDNTCGGYIPGGGSGGAYCLYNGGSGNPVCKYVSVGGICDGTSYGSSNTCGDNVIVDGSGKSYCFHNGGDGNYVCDLINAGECYGANYGKDNTCGGNVIVDDFSSSSATSSSSSVAPSSSSDMEIGECEDMVGPEQYCGSDNKVHDKLPCGSDWYNPETEFCQEGTDEVKPLCGGTATFT